MPNEADSMAALQNLLIEPKGPKDGETWDILRIAQYLSVTKQRAVYVVRSKGFPTPAFVKPLEWNATDVVGWVQGFRRQERKVVPSRQATIRSACIQGIPGLYEVPLTSVAPGVYFLCKDDLIVYVGQSYQPAVRIAGHAQENRISFDRAFVVPVVGERLNEVESAFIQQFRPPHNMSAPRCARAVLQVLHEFGVELPK